MTSPAASPPDPPADAQHPRAFEAGAGTRALQVDQRHELAANRFYSDNPIITRLYPDKLASAFARFDAARDTEDTATIAALREALAPSGDTKAAYMGEFYVRLPDWDDDGNEVVREINVPWTTIKEIMAAIFARAALARTLKGGDDAGAD